jgi:hypothetical protein
MGAEYNQARAQRAVEYITSKLEANGKLSLSDAANLQLDELDIVARETVPGMLSKMIQTTKLDHLINVNDEYFQLLGNWDYRMSANS